MEHGEARATQPGIKIKNETDLASTGKLPTQELEVRKHGIVSAHLHAAVRQLAGAMRFLVPVRVDPGRLLEQSRLHRAHDRIALESLGATRPCFG